MKKLLSQSWPILVWIALAAVIFSPAMGRFVLFPSPDSPPPPLFDRCNLLNELLSGAVSIAPHDLLRLAIPPPSFSDFSYAVDVVLIAAGFAYFLSGRGIALLPALFGGGAFAFMGYSLTLFSAGHRGFFHMTVYAVFLFGFLARAIEGRGAAYYALAACCAAWALRYQPDFAVVYFGLAAVYAIYLLSCRQPRRHADKGRPRRAKYGAAALPGARPPAQPLFVPGAAAEAAAKALAESTRRPKATHPAAGLLLAAAVFVFAAWPSVRTTLTTTLKGRVEQIEQVSRNRAAAGQGEADRAKASQADADSRWIFATDWSLPPEETLEFVAPAVKGRQTGDRDSPYWGRLGRSWKWEKTRRGFANFRQHVVYLGSIPLAFAILAALLALFGGGERKGLRAETAFWGAVWVAALLLAFGRHAPFYRLFYSIPYLSLLRAPVKFVRLIEFATAALAAIGLAEFLAAEAQSRTRRVCAFAAASLAVLFALVALFVRVAPHDFCAPLEQLGAAALVPKMAGQAVRALLHAVAGFGLVAILAAASLRRRPPAHVVVAILSLAVAADVALVARPFARAYDAERDYTDRNPVTEAALSARPAPSLASLVDQPELDEALRRNFGKHGIACHPRRDLDHASFLSAPGGGGIVRMMELCGARYALVPAMRARTMLRGRIEPVAGLRATGGATLFSKVAQPGKDDFMLFRLLAPEPYAKLHARWTYAPEEGFLGAVAREMGPDGPGGVVIGLDIPCDGAARDGTAETLAVQNIGGALETRVRTRAASAQVLALTRGYNKGNHVFVDGKPAESFMAGYGGTGVLVPRGEHLVVVRSVARNLPVAAASAAVLAAFFPLLAVALLRKSPSAPAPAPKCPEAPAAPDEPAAPARNPSVRRRLRKAPDPAG